MSTENYMSNSMRKDLMKKEGMPWSASWWRQAVSFRLVHNHVQRKKKSLTLISHLEFNCSLICNFIVVDGRENYKSVYRFSGLMPAGCKRKQRLLTFWLLVKDDLGKVLMWFVNFSKIICRNWNWNAWMPASAHAVLIN